MVKGIGGEAVIILAGEVSSDGRAPEYEKIAREKAISVGYSDSRIGMDASSSELCDVLTYITTNRSSLVRELMGTLTLKVLVTRG